MTALSEPLRMDLSDVCFLHWRVAPGALSRALPDWLDPHRRDGEAWVSLVVVVIERTRLGPLAGSRRLLGVNTRTYVRWDGGTGVYFFALDVDDRLAAATARTVFGLPYREAAATLRRDGERRTVRCQAREEPRAALSVSYEPTGPTAPAADGSLADFLTERYAYVTEAGGRRLRGEVGHEPWPQRDVSVTVERNGMFDPVGLDVSGDPDAAQFSPGVTTRTGPVRSLGTVTAGAVTAPDLSD